jgi:hypothetical protein
MAGIKLPLATGALGPLKTETRETSQLDDRDMEGREARRTEVVGHVGHGEGEISLGRLGPFVGEDVAVAADDVEVRASRNIESGGADEDI